MPDREFVDTNVLVYAFDLDAGPKRERAIELLSRLSNARTGCVSIQVLQEFYVTATRKLPMPASEARKQVERLGTWTVHRPSVEDVVAAIRTHTESQISFWDAMILRSASKLGCSAVWSEDLSHGQSWGAVSVRNPFRS